MLKKYTFDGSRKLDLGAMNTGAKEDKVVKEEIVQKTTVNQLAIQDLQDKLYADQKEGLIILIQARDAAGKDSTIKHVMSGINPQGVDVYSFKQPTSDELAHDFLWRVNRHIPRRGKIAIYNRSGCAGPQPAPDVHDAQMDRGRPEVFPETLQADPPL